MSTQNKNVAKDVALMGMMVAVIEVSKAALSFLPNIELTSFWLIMFTLYFGRKIFLIVPAFILVEGAIYGFGLWWLMYAYIWPLLVILAYVFKKNHERLFWAGFSGAFGLSFGFLCSFPYFFIGLSSGGVSFAFTNQFIWWVAGIVWDLVHCIGNFVLMFTLYDVTEKLFKRLGYKRI